MTHPAVLAALRAAGLEDRLIEFTGSTHTVVEAAAEIGCSPHEIAKSVALHLGEGAVVVLCAGDHKIDNARFKAAFGEKARMLSAAETPMFTGFDPGGVSPFGLAPGVRLFLDASLLDCTEVYPAGGDFHTVLRLTLNELRDACVFEDVVAVAVKR